MPDPDLYLEDEIHSSGYNMWIEYKCGSSDKGYIMKHIKTPTSGQSGNFCAVNKDILVLTNIGVQVSIDKLAD